MANPFDKYVSGTPAATGSNVFDKYVAPKTTPKTLPTQQPVSPQVKTSTSSSYASQPAYGASSMKDSSGKPLLTFRNDASKKSQLLDDRTFPGFDPTKKQIIPPSTLYNPRFARTTSDGIRKALGATAYQQLDHIMPLELGGSNKGENLRLQENAGGKANYEGGKQPLVNLENLLKRDAVTGKISVLEAWQEMAKAKGVVLSENKALPIATKPVGGKSVMPQAKNLTEKVAAGVGIARGIADIFNNSTQFVGSKLGEQVASTVAQIVPATKQAALSVKGKGINNLNNKLSDATGGQAFMHPVDTFVKLKKDIWNESGAAEKRVVDSFKRLNADVEGRGAQTKTERVANLADFIASTAGLAMMPISVPFQIGSQLPVFKPAFDLVGVVFDQAGKVVSYNVDKTLQLIPDAVLSPEQKDMLAAPVHELGTLAGQLLLGGKLLHEVTSLAEIKAKTGEIISGQEFQQMYDSAKREADQVTQLDMRRAVQSGDVTKINEALGKVSPKIPTAEDFVASKDAKLRAKDEIPKQLDSLAAEARKYKSADEFANGVLGKEIDVPMESLKPNIARDMTLGSSKSSGPLEVSYGKDGKFYIGDGNHRYYEALDRGDSTVRVRLSSDATLMPQKDSLTDFYNKAVGTPKYRVANDLNNESLTTKILDKLKDKTTVSRQFIEDLTNSPDLKQSERDLIRSKLAEATGDKIDVQKFSDEVKAELLPLERTKFDSQSASGRYEFVALPSESRGPIANYSEHIYQSPVKTSAGDVHFAAHGGKAFDGYFGHTRVEDLPDSTRRVIEVQSDLFQKGNLENERNLYDPDVPMLKGDGPGVERANALREKMRQEHLAVQKNLDRLDPYQNNAAHFRMIREEVRQAALDGKTKLQFPTGETAMKIEGLGDNSVWRISGPERELLTQDNLKVGQSVWDRSDGGHDWIITDVLGDGKFKAVPADLYNQYHFANDRANGGTGDVRDVENRLRGRAETFDISGKVDTSNPIYKFYEKDVGRYLKNKYDAKLITDKQGVSWWEADIKPEHKGAVEAFRLKDDLAAKGIDITDAQEKEIIDLNKKMFGDADVKITGQILANKEALGKYQEGIIEILKGQAEGKATFYHEAVHKYLDVFTDKAEHADILREGAKKYGIDDFAQVEERIAEDFIKYAETRTGVTGKLKTYFDTIINRINSFLGNGSKIDQLYADIISGKAKDVVENKITSAARNINQELVSKGFNALPEESLASYTPIKKADVIDKVTEFMTKDIEKAKEAAISGEVPNDINKQVLFNAVEEFASKEGDVQLLIDLAKSPIAEERSVAAQTLGASGFNQNPDSAVAKIKEVTKAREEAIVKKLKSRSISKAKEKVSSDIKREIRKKAPTRETWASFVESIQC